MAHKKRVGYRYDSDDPELFRKDVEEVYSKAVTIPVNLQIEGDHCVLSYDKAKEILMKANRVSLLDCVCRTKRPNCDLPIRTCIGVNRKADRILNGQNDDEGWPGKYNPQEISLEEALKVLEMSHKAGLVHMALTQNKDTQPEEIDYICSCCTCCCSILAGTIRYGMAPHLLTSYKISVTNKQACNACGICETRCQFGAREILNGKLVFKPELCLGCGVCVTTCPKNAITLVAK
jgi:ferredoxin